MASFIFKYVKEKPLSSNKLQQCIDANLNVLLIGEFGTGKTERVLSTFEKNFGDKWAFLNGATADPWTDLIGIPAIREENGESYIKYVRPEEINDNIEGIYIDELNRAKTATRNALLELIQFKSINGRKFPKLRVIWSSINPPPDEDNEEAVDYDVEELDPAIIDRFHVWLRVSPEPDMNWFVNKYGDIGRNVVSWWKQQPKEAKKIIHSRRLEYIIIAHKKGIDINDLLPSCSGIKLLKQQIDSNPVEIEFLDLLDKIEKDPKEKANVVNLIKDENKFEQVKDLIIEKKLWWILNFLSEDRIDVLYQKYGDSIKTYFYENFDNTSKLFKFLAKRLQHDVEFKNRLNRCINEFKPKVDQKSSIRLVDNKEDFKKIIASYLTISREAKTVLRRNYLKALCLSIPEYLAVEDGRNLLAFLNKYSEKIQGATLRKEYPSNRQERTNFIDLCKLYITFAKAKGLNFDKEPFSVKLVENNIQVAKEIGISLPDNVVPITDYV